MIQRELKITGLFLISMLTNLLYAQQASVTSGGDATGSGGSASYSIGQVVYTTNLGTNGSVAQGIQNAYIITPLSNQELTALTLSVQTYPNPTTDKIVLALNNIELKDLSYVLYDLSGRTIANALVNQTQTEITMQNLAAGVYILRVNQNYAELKTFKIIKN
jgi:hypothetical protein